MHAIRSFESQAAGEAATTVTIEMLKDWTPEGAATIKTRLRELVSNVGRIGQVGFFANSPEGFAKMHNELKTGVELSKEQEQGHCNRTHLPIERVRSLMLQQYDLNDRGFLFSFYTDVETRTILTLEYHVVDIDFDVDSILAMPPAMVQTIHDARRTIVQVQEPVNDDGRNREIEVFLNEGRDALMIEAYKQFIVQTVGVAEESIDSMLSIFDELPSGTGRLNLTRDPVSGSIEFLVGSEDSLMPLGQYLQSRSAASADGQDAEDVDETDAVDFTDPVDPTADGQDADVVDGISSAMQGIQLDEMDRFNVKVQGHVFSFVSFSCED